MVKSMKQFLFSIICMLLNTVIFCHADELGQKIFKNDIAFVALAPAGSGSLDLNKAEMFPAEFQVVKDDFMRSSKATVKYSLMEPPRSIVLFDKNKSPIGCIVWSPYLKQGRFFMLANCHINDQKIIRWSYPVDLTLDGYEKRGGKDIRDWIADFMKKSEPE